MFCHDFTHRTNCIASNCVSLNASLRAFAVYLCALVCQRYYLVVCRDSLMKSASLTTLSGKLNEKEKNERWSTHSKCVSASSPYRPPRRLCNLIDGERCLHSDRGGTGRGAAAAVYVSTDPSFHCLSERHMKPGRADKHAHNEVAWELSALPASGLTNFVDFFLIFHIAYQGACVQTFQTKK